MKVLHDKGHDFVFLEEQYRMRPAISEHPNEAFYDGKLRNAPITEVADAIVDAGKMVHNQLADHEEHDPRGSKYFVVSVTQARTHVEPNGTSLLNYAFAEADRRLVQMLTKKGIARFGLQLPQAGKYIQILIFSMDTISVPPTWLGG